MADNRESSAKLPEIVKWFNKSKAVRPKWC